MKSKAIEYCYPTSTHAKTLGRYNEGCYCVELWHNDGIELPKLLINKAFDTAQDAIKAAKEINDLPFHPLTQRFFASML